MIEKVSFGVPMNLTTTLSANCINDCNEYHNCTCGWLAGDSENNNFNARTAAWETEHNA